MKNTLPVVVVPSSITLLAKIVPDIIALPLSPPPCANKVGENLTIDTILSENESTANLTLDTPVPTATV